MSEASATSTGSKSVDDEEEFTSAAVENEEYHDAETSREEHPEKVAASLDAAELPKPGLPLMSEEADKDLLGTW